MPNSYKRSDRVGKLIFETVSEIVRSLKELDGFLTSVTKVKLTDDLLNCRIFYSVFGDETQKSKAGEIIKKQTKEIRKSLASTLNLRRTPEIIFEYDDTNDAADRVFSLLDKIKDE